MSSKEKHKARSCYKSHNKGGYEQFTRYAKIRDKVNESRREQNTLTSKAKGVFSFIKAKFKALRDK